MPESGVRTHLADLPLRPIVVVVGEKFEEELYLNFQYHADARWRSSSRIRASASAARSRTISSCRILLSTTREHFWSTLLFRVSQKQGSYREGNGSRPSSRFVLRRSACCSLQRSLRRRPGSAPYGDSISLRVHGDDSESIEVHLALYTAQLDPTTSAFS